MVKNDNSIDKVTKLEKEVLALKGFIEYFSGGGIFIETNSNDESSKLWEYMRSNKIPFEYIVLLGNAFRIPEPIYQNLQDSGYKIRKLSYEESYKPMLLRKPDEIRANLRERLDAIKKSKTQE